MFKLSQLRAVYEQPILHNDTFLLMGTLPVETFEEFRRDLPSFTEGEGVFVGSTSRVSQKRRSFPHKKAHGS